MKRLIQLLFLSMMLLAAGVAAQGTVRDRGIALYREGDFDGAVSALQRAVELNERDGPAWKYLGAALMNLDRKNEAFEALTKRNLDPSTFAAERGTYTSPLKIISKVPAIYTSKARKRNIEGEVTLAAEMKATGEIGFIVAIRTLEGGLTESAIKSARKIKFKPAEQNGKPVTTIQMVTYNFNQY